MNIKFFVAIGTVTRSRKSIEMAITVHPMLLLTATQAEAQRTLEQRLNGVNPRAQGWTHEECAVYEIPQQLENGGYRLTWQIEPS